MLLCLAIVYLTSSVLPGSYVYPEQAPTYTCITRDSSLLNWWYNNREDHVSLIAIDKLGTSRTNDLFNATLVNTTRTSTGETVIISTLHLNRIVDYVITITCRNGDLQVSTNITSYKNGQAASSYLILILVTFTIFTTA